MKFARYLHETQTPEWKKAYIDYRGLKKRINAIRMAQSDHSFDSDSPVVSDPEPKYKSSLGDCTPEDTPDDCSMDECCDGQRPIRLQLRRKAGISFISFETSKSSCTIRKDEQVSCGNSISDADPQKESDLAVALEHSFPSSPIAIAFNDNSQPVVIADNMSHPIGSRPMSPLTGVLPLRELLPLLSPLERHFFSDLDKELEKVEHFYLDREKEMKSRSMMLEDQLAELFEHQAVHAANETVAADWPWSPAVRYIKTRTRSKDNRPGGSVTKVQRRISVPAGSDTKYYAHPSTAARQSRSFVKTHYTKASQPQAMRAEDYLYAKKKLKKAVAEHYRGLEMLDNYRILNETGFRKALKKFEKVSKIPALHAYMEERVEPSSFASGKIITDLSKDMVDLYAARFEGGDKKRALARLRPTPKSQSYHSSAARTGLLLGLALFALFSGLWKVHALSEDGTISDWNTLLLVYGIFFPPVLFAFLVGLNVLAWSRAKINYVFIFELDARTRLDHREYFEIPALLLSTLCITFWLSVSGAASSLVHDPKTWPLIWLGFAALVMLNPFPVASLYSRWWFLKHLGKLLISGTHRVNFTDFWLADQLCSLVFSISNTYVVVCVYASEDFKHALEGCTPSQSNWPIFFSLAALPFFIRLVQCVKRYTEKKKKVHLINGGKYTTSILSYLYYFLLRHRNNRRTDLALWCFFTACSTIYSSSWDLLVDWSLLRPSARHRFLRADLLYNNHISIYYASMISNTLIRLAWIFYITIKSTKYEIWSFTIALLEILRRWQWNFYRLENEQVGNMDQYQVTREVSLPYSFDNSWYEDDREDFR